MYQAMREADDNYDGKLKSASGLVGTDGEKMHAAREAGTLLCGKFIGKVMEKALKTGESNACMKRIVAAPTAGSCGVVPAVFLTLEEEKHFSEEKMVEALYVAAGIGGVIANRAFPPGRPGGCQAEIGSASAMAAGGVAYLMGGDAVQISMRRPLALKKSARTCLRSRGRSGRSTMCEAQCDGSGQCNDFVGYGHGWNHK